MDKIEYAQFNEYCHLSRRKNQLKIHQHKIFDLKQQLFQLQEHLAREVRRFDDDERKYWYRWEKVKTEDEKVVQPESELVKMLKELDVSAEEAASILRSELGQKP